MKTWLYQLASPKIFYRVARRFGVVFGVLSALCLLAGLWFGLVQAPPDYQQGDAYRIMFIHVPSAVLSMSAYALIAINSAIFLIWRSKVSDVIASVTVPIGASFTALALLTGALWGKPMWGTFWIWDARLTSELVLLFLYFGLFAIRRAVVNQAQSQRVTAILAVVGAIDLPIIHYSVNWWHSLHQGSTLLGWHKPELPMVMLLPLLFMITGFLSFLVAQVCAQARNEILWRERDSQWVQQEVSG